MTGGKLDLTESPTKSPGNRIEKRVWIRATPEVVYRALTSSKDLAKWFCDEADCTPCEGGELIALWKAGKDGYKGRAVFTSVKPNVRLELLWVEEGCEPVPGSTKHTLCYTIKSKSGMTEVLMVDTDEAALDEETYTVLDQGWNSVLLELKDFCERKERSLKLRPASNEFHDPY